MSVNYIFCISTGRCGTEYLYSLFKLLENCNAYHEQKPLLHNKEMQEYLKGNKTLLQKKIANKLHYILKEKNKLYVDTSHLFIKGFGWEIPKHIPQEQIGVIILKREKELVVNSTQRVQSGPFSYYGRKWIITPNRNNLIKPPINFFWYTFYRILLKVYWIINGQNKQIVKSYPKYFKEKSKKLIEWYYDETYALGEKYKITYPNIKYVDINLSELNTYAGFKRIINRFGLEKKVNEKSLKDYIGVPKNLKQQFK